MKSARLLVLFLFACSHPAAPAGQASAPQAATVASAPPVAASGTKTLTILGTNDVHGAIERVPLFSGFVANVRAARAADGGGVVLVDGGDMFQGTLESNLAEGADMVRAYNKLAYDAVAVGNHEFDYGPAGPKTTPSNGEDPRGALKARASEAHFPFLVSNIADAQTGARIEYPNMPASTLIERAGVKIGIIGVSTEVTPTTTMAANFAGLQMMPPAPAVIEQAKVLRDKGAQVIIATMHVGSSCRDVEHHDDTSSCDKDEEIFPLIAALPKGTVDVMVGGHTHAGMAHMIDGIAVIESYASGRAFGRIDLTLDASGKIVSKKIFAPHLMCPLDKNHNPAPVAECDLGSYEGKPVVADPEVKQIADAALARAAERRSEPLGITVTKTITRAHSAESAEGNLLTDLMLAARKDAQIAMTNGGGLRADIPAGALTYGQLFESTPFDNRFVIVDVTGKTLREVLADNLGRDSGLLSFSGLTARAACKAGKLDIEIKVAGKPVSDSAHYKIATSDFLTTGGDGVFQRVHLPASAIQVTDVIIRDAMADVLRSWKGTAKATIDPDKLLVKKSPRLEFPGKRPVRCDGASGKEASK
ncbi:MAG TPA: bifunctional UDP-sugar hydrolase/5'-nucleotidase [Kofleriaceae bacterium]|nr:bifunctional UDP-sugar hydrolase/5'-nucleotidase [Kofleriaceae bacterium]